MHRFVLLNVGGTVTILGVHSPSFYLEKVSLICSFPDFVMACSLPKFSLNALQQLLICVD